MGKFATVRPASDATTVRRKESASLNSLYEVKELFNVGDVDDTENEDPKIVQSNPLINTASNSYWLALSVNDDVSIFDVTVDCTYESNVPVKGLVCGLAWLGDSSLLSIFTTERCFTMISMKFGKLLEINMHDELVTQCSSAKISTTEIGEQCFICIVDDSGVTNTVVFSNWRSFMNCNDTEHSRDGLQKVLSSITYSCSKVKNSITDMLASKALPAIIALPEQGDHFVTSSFSSISFGGQIDNTFLHDTKLSAPIVRMREVCGGRYLVGVTSSGQMVIHDLWSFCHLTYAKPIDLKIGKNAHVIDFLFIDKAKEEFSYKNVVLVVQKDDALNLEVVSLPGGSVSYSLDIELGTKLMFADTESNQRVMIIIEPLQDGHGVTLKEIAEAEPEQKLTRLIEQNRLDEAEKFAIEFGLDCQRVHVSRMDMLYVDATSNDSPEIFKKFMASMDKVKDDNRVAETCYSGATTFLSFSRIQDLLQYVEKRNVTDKECAKRLDSIAYTFGTYRIVTKPEGASFDHWEAFVEGIDGPGSWMDIFNSFVEGGFIAEARVIFNRHTKYVVEGISLDISIPPTSGGGVFFSILKNTLMNNISLWSDLISFIEYDIIPFIIPSSDTEDKVYTMMVEFLLFLAKRLEKFDPSNFPQNAYHATTTLERIFGTLAAQSITPAKQALLAMIGRKYFSPQNRSHELVVYSENLAAIQRLKEVYHCALSYDDYIALDAERICYHILQSAVENPNMVTARVEKYARPYMDEHRLDPDRTIFHYIEEVSRNALYALSGANPWHEQCLLISETIKNFSLRCQAILIIAKSMQPPWPKRLSEAVQSILGSNLIDVELTKQLQMVCYRADLGKILQSHNVSFSLLDTVLSNERQFSRFLRYLIQQEETADDLVKSALKAVELYKKLNNETTYQVDDNLVYSSIATQLLTGRGVKDMIKYLDGLQSVDESIQSEVVDTLIDKLIHQINSSVEFRDDTVVKERLNILYAVESIIQHFRSDNFEQMITYNEVVSIRKLQERYNRWITIVQLHDHEWKDAEFSGYLIEGQHDLPELYAFANAIGLSPDDARIVTIGCVIKAGMLNIVVSVLKESMLTILKPSAKLVAMYMSGCEFIFTSVHTAYCSDEDNSDALLEEAMDVMWMMKPILAGLTTSATEFEQFLEKSLRMEHFLRLFLMTFDQFVMDDSPQSNSSEDNQEKFSKSSNIGTEWGMSRRVGVYQVQKDGPIMGKKEALVAMLAVAPTVLYGYENCQRTIEQINEMHNKWDDLCNILTHEHQDVLVYAYRVFSAYLPCFFGTENLVHDNLRQVANSLCEKTIQSHPCDMWSATAVIMSLVPQKRVELTIHLRTWLSKRKSPQTVINYLRITQFIVINMGLIEQYGVSLTNMFVVQLWCKRLAKVGSSVKSTKDLSAALEDFSKKKIDPVMVAEYFVQFFPEQADDQMLNYAMMLVAKASTSSSEADIDALLQTANSAMKLCNSTRNHIYWRCRRALYTLCPYNYEPILFLIRIMSSCVVTDDVESYNEDSREPAAFVDGCQNLMELLVHTTRSGGITKAEINWYMQYLKVCQLDKKENGDKVSNRKYPDCYGTRLMAWFEQGSELNITMERSDNDLKYERADLLASTLPSRAHNIVPVHIFLVRLQSDVHQWLEPVIEAEVNLYTVKVWKTLRKVVSWLEILPREMFLRRAVMKKVNECILKGLELQPMDKTVILELFTAKHSAVDDVASCIAFSAKNLTLSAPKVQLISLGIEVANGWLTSCSLNEKTKASVMDTKLRYEQLVENYKTELLLKKEGLYDSKTSDLVEHPADLICHIYSENIEWSSRVDIKRKSDLIDQLAEMNNINLSDIQNDLVYRWLDEGQVADAFAVNLDDTMGSISLPAVVDTKDDDNDILPLPLFDASITKIVHLLKQQNYHDLFNKIFTKYVREYTATNGGYKTAIRAICVLLRTLTDEDFERYNITENKLGGLIESVLNTRLFEVARVEQPYSCYISQEKLSVARSLMAPTKRHTPELCSLAAAVVIDSDLQDKALIETLLTKLSQARRKEIYIELLKHCRDSPALASVKNLGSFWPRLIDTSSIHENSRDEVLYWTYFLLSCPVELRGFDPIRTMAHKLPVAATVLSIASNFTKSVAKIGKHDQTVSEAKDPRFAWSIQHSSSPAFSNNDSMEF